MLFSTRPNRLKTSPEIINRGYRVHEQISGLRTFAGIVFAHLFCAYGVTARSFFHDIKLRLSRCGNDFDRLYFLLARLALCNSKWDVRAYSEKMTKEDVKLLQENSRISLSCFSPQSTRNQILQLQSPTKTLLSEFARLWH